MILPIAAVAGFSLTLFPYIYSTSGSFMGALITTALGSAPVFVYFKQHESLFVNYLKKPDRQALFKALLGTRSSKKKEK